MNCTIAAAALAGEYEVGFKETPALYQKTVKSLEEAGIRVIKTDTVMYDTKTMLKVRDAFLGKQFDAFLICVGTWSEDHHVLDLMHYLDKPVILCAFPGMETGSLCGVQQITSVFRDINFTDFTYTYAEPGDPETAERILSWVKTISLREMLRHTVIGSIGNRCAGMTETAYDEFALLEHLGVRIVTIDESEMLEETAAAAQKEEEISALLASWRTRFHNIRAGEDALRESAAWYLAMKALISRYGLSGLTIKCYTKYMGKICFGQALLAEEGIVASCEGDVGSAVMMKILYELTGECVNCTDYLNPDPAANAVLFAHCGNTGFSLAESEKDIELCPVRIMETGVCGRFTCRPGTVTAADLVGHGGTLRMSVMTGDAISCSMEFPGTPIKVHFDRPVLELCDTIIRKGCGHHWMIGYGNVSAQLKGLCERCGIEYIPV